MHTLRQKKKKIVTEKKNTFHTYWSTRKQGEQKQHYIYQIILFFKQTVTNSFEELRFVKCHSII